MGSRKILIVEDDQVVVSLVRAALKADFIVDNAVNLKQCMTLLQSETNYQLILIDRMLPDGDGLTLCGQIREMDGLAQVPVIFLSAKDSEADKVSGLFAGADDYMTKPFGLLELKARVLAHLRKQTRKLSAGHLHMDPESLRVFLHNGQEKTEILLTPLEFKLLQVLMNSLGDVISRENILVRVWGQETHVSDRVVDSHISHLRKKIRGSDLLLEGLRGEGYRLTLNEVAIKKRLPQAA